MATGGDYSIKAAIVATSTIPIVFTTGNDPVAAGYVKSLRQPGGNATGVTFLASSLEAKRLEMLHEIDPKATSVAVLIGPADARAESDIREIEGAAKSLALSVRFVGEFRARTTLFPPSRTSLRIGTMRSHRDRPLLLRPCADARCTCGASGPAYNRQCTRVRSRRRAPELRRSFGFGLS